MKRKLIYLLYQHFADKRLLFAAGFIISILMALAMQLFKKGESEISGFLFLLCSITFFICFFFTLGEKGFEISRDKKRFEHYLGILNNDLSTREQIENASWQLINHMDITEEIILLIIEENEENNEILDIALEKYNVLRQKNNSS